MTRRHVLAAVSIVTGFALILVLAGVYGAHRSAQLSASDARAASDNSTSEGNAGGGPVVCVADVNQLNYGVMAVQWSPLPSQTSCAPEFALIKRALYDMGYFTLTDSLPAGYLRMCSLQGRVPGMSVWVPEYGADEFADELCNI
jgi:hypothetical protein